MNGFHSEPFSINAFSPQFGGVISHERYEYECHGSLTHADSSHVQSRPGYA